MYYTGIGSRDIPKEYFNLFTRVGKYLAKEGYILRSGRADGSDTAFEIGCIIGNGKKEIYIPWNDFEGDDFKRYINSLNYPNKNRFRECFVLSSMKNQQEAVNIAKKYHPIWNTLKVGSKKLQARNTYQVLGQDLSTPSDFVICYTKDGKGLGD